MQTNFIAYNQASASLHFSRNLASGRGIFDDINGNNGNIHDGGSSELCSSFFITTQVVTPP